MSERKTETVWITKYAIGGKVRKEECEITSDGCAILRDSWFQIYHGEGREWHRTKESAQQRVAEMVEAKRKSLMKSLAKLEKPIEVPE